MLWRGEEGSGKEMDLKGIWCGGGGMGWAGWVRLVK